MKLRLPILILLLAISGIVHAQSYNPVLWQQKDGPLGGEVIDIEFDASSGRLFAIVGDSRLLYYSDDEGATWTKKTTGAGDFNFFNDIEITNNSIYLTTSFSVWMSADGGNIFSEISDNSNFNNANRIIRLSNGRLVVLGNNAIHYSINNGGNWTQGYQPPTSFNGRWLASNDADQIFMIVDERPYRSNDFGVNFSEFSTGIPVGERVNSLVRNNAGTGIYCVTEENIYVSDGNSDWVSIAGGSISDATISDFGGQPSFIEFSADGLGMYFIDNLNKKLHAKATGDGPANWALRQSSFPTTTTDVVAASAKNFPTANTSTAFFGAEDGVYKTTSGGTTFSAANSGIAGMDPSVFFATSFQGLFMQVGQDILRSTNDGDSWSQLSGIPPDGISSFITNSVGDQLYLATSDKIYQAFDGSFWSEITPPLSSLFFPELFAPDADNLFARDFDRIYHSPDRGSTWSPAVTITGLPMGGIGPNDFVFISPFAALWHLRDFAAGVDKLYLISLTYAADVLVSATATDISANLPLNVDDVSNLYASNGKAYAETFAGGLAGSDDGGQSWQMLSLSNPFGVFLARNGYMFATFSGNQIHISRDGGETFQTTTLDLNASIQDIRGIDIDADGIAYLAIRDNFVYASTKSIVVPEAPTNAIELGNIGRTVAIAWDDNSTNEEQFNVSISVDGVNYTSAGVSFDNSCTTPNGRGFFTLENLTPDTDYSIRIVAQSEAGTSAPTQVDILTDATVCSPTIPDNRSWSAVNSQESGFPAAGPKTVGIVHLGNGKYKVSDVGLGLLGGSPFFHSGDVSATFYENCGETLLGDDDRDVRPNGVGTWDGVNTLTLKWRTCRADEFETITFTLNGDDPAPAAPQNPLAYSLTATSIEVNWQTSYFQTSFVVERSLNGTSGWTEVGTVNYPTQRLVDNGPLTVGTTYYYRVKALNAEDEASPYSAVTSVAFSVPKFLLGDNAITNTQSATIGSYFADFNNDGFDDYFTMSFDIETESGSPVIFQNNGAGDFTPVVPVFDSQPYFFATIADYDNDSKVDVLFHAQEAAIADLYRGNGNFTFTKVNSGLGDLANVTAEDIEIQSSSWGDLNNDGLLDLIVAGPRQTNGSQGRLLVYRQNANHSFTKIPAGDMSTDTERSFGAFWADYNNDGFQDVAIANSGGPCRLYKNNGNETFTKMIGGGFDANAALLIAWGDYNNDGFMDMFVPNSAQHALYKNNGNETFTKDVSTQVSQIGQVVGTVWADYNNDGYLDLFTSGFIGVPARLFMRDASVPSVVTFTEIDNEKINDFSVFHYGASTADYDRNGFMDIAMSAFQFSEDGDDVSNANGNLFDNNILTGNWSEIKLNPLLGNKGGVGARVTVQAGGITQTREFPTSNSLVSRSTSIAHFGIGSASTINNIQVKWANGDVQNYPNPPKNQFLVINQDSQGPTISTREPAHESVDINTTTSIVLTLNEAGTAVVGKNLMISPAAGGPAVFALPVTSALKDGNKFTFALTGKLQPLTEYTVTLDAGAFLDKYTNPSPEVTSLSWTFTTIAAPEAVTLSPAHNATGILADTKIKITLDRATTPVAGKFLLLYLHSNLAAPITGVDLGEADQNGNEYTFTLPSKLASNTQYNISVDAGAFVDGNGNESLEFPTGLWTFTVGNGPIVSALTPAHNATGIDANTSLKIDFNADVEAVAGKSVKIFKASDLVNPVHTFDASEGTIDGASAEFELTELLESGIGYKVSIEQGAFVLAVGKNDFTGLAAANWSFTTSTGPVVTELLPANADVNVDANSALVVKFGETVDPVSGKNLKIFEASDLVNAVDVIDLSSATNNGGLEFTFTPTITLAPNTTYKVSIDAGAFVSIAGGNSFAGLNTSAWSFTTSIGPSITGLSPANGSGDIDANTTLVVSFGETVDPNPGKKLRIFEASDLVNAVDVIDLSSAANNGGLEFTFTPTITLAPSTTYKVSIDLGAFVSTAGSNSFVGLNPSAWSFTTSAGPGITTLTPDDGSVDVEVTTTLVVTLDEEVSPVPGKSLKLFNSSNLSTPVQTVDLGTATSPDGMEFTFTPSGPLAEGTTFNVSIDAGAFVSIAGQNIFAGLDAADWSFTTATGPQLIAFSPTNNATGVNANADLSITFDEPVNVIPGFSLKLFKSANLGSPVASIPVEDAAPDGETFVFNLTGFLDPTTMYTVSIDAGAFRKIAGNHPFAGLATGVWSFTTAAGPATTALSPADGAIANANTNLVITFDTNVNPQASKSIKIYKSSDLVTPVQTVAATEAQVAGGIVTFDVPQNLERATTYKIALEEGAFRSVAGSNASQPIATGDWSFTTDAGPTASVSPANNATGVGLDQQLVLTFNRNINGVAGKKLRVKDGTETFMEFDVTTTGTIGTTTYVLDAPEPDGWPEGSILTAIVDPGAFVDNNENQFAGIAEGAWTFTTVRPDREPPVISFTPPSNPQKGFGTSEVSFGVTDESVLASIEVWIRPISGAEYEKLDAAPGTTAGTYKVTISESQHFDAIGTEFYIVATDEEENLARSPADPGTYKVYLQYNGTQAAVPSNKLGLGGQKSNWKVFTIPFDIPSPNNAITSIMEEITSPTLGLENKVDYRIIRINTAGTEWLEYPSAFTTLDRGKGYFINVKQDPGNINLPNSITVPHNSRKELYQLVLTPGWNMVGNPYLTPISWDNVAELNTELSGTGTQLIQYTSSGYAENQNLNPYEGGFVFNSLSTNLTLKIPFFGQTSTDGRKSSRDLSRDIDSKGWILPVQLSQAETTYTLGAVGMTPEARLSLDDFDGVTPPRFFDYLEINFAHPEHPAGRLTRDVVPTTDAYTWEFSVASNLTGPAELHWDNTVIAGADHDVFLLDVARQQLINMKETGSYLFDPKESANFRLYFGQELNVSPDGVHLGKAYPNPTNGLTTISFSLPEKGGMDQLVSLELLDAMGRTQGVLVHERMAPGYHEAVFDAGTLYNGFYTYRLTVQGINGKSTHVNKLIIK